MAATTTGAAPPGAPRTSTLPVRARPQASLSSYPPRLRAYNNSLLTPVSAAAASTGPTQRTTKRGTTMVNYAEDGYDDVDDDDEGTSTGTGRRRPTGLRNLRREDTSGAQPDPADRIGKDTYEPVEMQGVYRDWMSRNRYHRSDHVLASQAKLPLTLIPIRLDVDIPAFVPPPAILAQPPPGTYDPTPFRPGEQTAPYKLRDQFMWNLHESLTTTDQFATTLVQDLDLPNPGNATVNEISKQIRTQLEEYAGVALHPLFRTEASGHTPKDGTRRPPSAAAANGGDDGADKNGSTPQVTPTATAEATLVRDKQGDLDPDDTYRCIINISVNLSSALYTDKFEWSLLHPPGAAETFAKTTCADLGLHGEWIPAITHAIYEAVLRLKKEACEAGGLVTGWAGGVQEHPNDAVEGTEAGWRYDPEQLGDAWEPKVEILSKEEIEKRELDRERQIRRLRRETARFTSTSGLFLVGGGGVAAQPDLGLVADEDRFGRGERSKKKRRFRSLSPLARGTPDITLGLAGYGGGGALTDQERAVWRCSHCRIRGTCVWAVRDGPHGPKTLCSNCAFSWERDQTLPTNTKNLHVGDSRIA